MRRFTAPDLLIATHNRGKLDEFRALLAPYPVRVLSNADFALSEPDETETTFAGNARIKALAGMRATGLPTLADDSGLTVDALGGLPGIHTADWAEGPGGRDWTRAMGRVQAELDAQAAPEPRRGAFCCTLVLCWPNGDEAVFDGQIAGRLVWPPRGVTGHGYDPMFQPDGHDRTFAEMTAGEKNAISHRSIALRQFLAACFGG
jgi:XTP/dITP diphosphohydrolase